MINVTENENQDVGELFASEIDNLERETEEILNERREVKR